MDGVCCKEYLTLRRREMVMRKYVLRQDRGLIKNGRCKDEEK
jgi:hypothetical protein